jgi:heme-degrading monooxygenase HmoA
MIRVLIERHIADSLEHAYEERARRYIQRAVSAPGFVSGESLVDSRDQNHRFTISTWRSETDWLRWKRSDERRSLMAELIPMMDRDEVITVMKHFH